MQKRLYLEVKTQELAKALLTMKKISKPQQHGGESVLTFANGFLVINTNGFISKVKANGEWRGSLIISADYLSKLAPLLPKSETIILKAEDNRFHLGPSSIDCIIHEENAPYIELPADPPLWMTLGLVLKYTDDELERAGKLSTVIQAREEFEDILEKCAKLLQTLGVNRNELRDFVNYCIKKKNTSN